MPTVNVSQIGLGLVTNLLSYKSSKTPTIFDSPYLDAARRSLKWVKQSVLGKRTLECDAVNGSLKKFRCLTAVKKLMTFFRKNREVFYSFGVSFCFINIRLSEYKI